LARHTTGKLQRTTSIVQYKFNRSKRSTLVGGLTGITLAAVLVYAATRVELPLPAKIELGIDAEMGPHPKSDRVRVATFNIRGGRDLDDENNLTRVIDWLHGNDIAVLNEVIDHRWGTHQAGAIASELRTHWLYAPTRSRLLGTRGNALMVRTQPLDYGVISLPHPDTQRNAVHASIPFGSEIVEVIGTHLERGKLGQDQLDVLIERFLAADVAILLGDLNTRRDEPPLSNLLERSDVTDAITVALGRPPPLWVVDWILVRGMRVVNGGSVERGISDHMGFWVELTLNPESPTNL
jgi:endonuclease/exonuclease/phosphatase family metal-dependent hydrolase